MTMFRVGPAGSGGGGIPPELQAGMDSVLNKKWGTSTTYPATGWPDTVNLMGPLDEKTASGAIVHIEDGADAVPLKSWEIDLPASLTGYSSVDCTKAGKNILDATYFETYSNWRTDLAPNGDYPTGNANRGLELAVKSGVTYAVSFGMDSVTYPTYLYLCRTNGTTSERLIYFSGANFSLDSGTFTAQAGYTYYFRMGATGSEENFNTQISKLSFEQIELGSTATTYEAYNATTKTANLGRTVYGGTVDVVTGEGTETYIKVVFDGTEQWQKSGSALNGFYTPMAAQGLQAYTDVLCNKATMAGSASDYYNNYDKCYVDYYFAINLDPDVVGNTVAQFKQWLSDQYTGGTPLEIVGKLETDTTFAFTPITPTPETALGVNNLWADAGDSEVTYRSGSMPASIPIALHEGKLKVSDGTISADSNWFYTDPFECPNGYIIIDIGEATNDAGIELINADNSHANYWNASSRYRAIDISSAYAATKKARITFKKQYLNNVLLLDIGHRKQYTNISFTPYVFEE